MDKLKQWVALTALAVVAIGAAGWFLAISPKKSDATELNSQADTTVTASGVLRNDIKVLQAQAKSLPRERGKLAAVAAKLPSDPGMPALIRALTAAADASGVKLVSLTPGAPVAATAVASTPAKSSAATDDKSSAAKGDDAAAPAKVALPVPTGLTTIPVEISVFGGFYQAQRFAAELEDLPRAFRVKGLAIAPGADPGSAATKSASAATDGQNLVTVISGEVFMSTLTSASAGASGTAS